MKIIIRMALRNIMRHKRRSLFTGLMMAGAFLLFSVSLGVTEGSYSKMIDIYTQTHTGHIQIHKKGYLDKPSIYDNFDSYAQIGIKLKSIPDVIAWAPRVYAPALAFISNKTTGVRITGIDPGYESVTTLIKDKLKEGRYLSSNSVSEVMITTRLARVLKAKLNDDIALIGQASDGSIANDIFSIVGIIEGDNIVNCYMHINVAQNFMTLNDRIHEIAVLLSHYALSEKVAGLIRDSLGDESLDIKPWNVIEKHFYRAMQMDKQGNWITQFIIMLIVGIGVLNSVLMTLLERTREFGILRAVGTRPYQIFVLILFETGFLGFFSIVIGGGLSLLCNYLLSVYGITLPTPIELEGLRFESYVSEITAKTILLPAIITFFVALGVSTVPALRAARITPVKALRTE